MATVAFIEAVERAAAAGWIHVMFVQFDYGSDPAIVLYLAAHTGSGRCMSAPIGAGGTRGERTPAILHRRVR